jgi:hypothetical protein
VNELILLLRIGGKQKCKMDLSRSGIIADTQMQRQQSHNSTLTLAYPVQPQMTNEQQVYTLKGNVPSIPHSQPELAKTSVLPTTSAQIEIP